MSEQTIKKESGLTFKKGFLNSFRGSLVLTSSELYFESKDKKVFSVLISDIENSRAKKGIGNGLDYLVIEYKEDGKSKKTEFEHMAFVSGLAMGNMSQLRETYFKSWETIIEETRMGKNKKASGLDDIEKLADLKAKGHITEAEYEAKKKQILGL